jgi:hypothetical protein
MDHQRSQGGIMKMCAFHCYAHDMALLLSACMACKRHQVVLCAPDLALQAAKVSAVHPGRHT